jgi:hypothetical protein
MTHNTAIAILHQGIAYLPAKWPKSSLAILSDRRIHFPVTFLQTRPTSIRSLSFLYLENALYALYLLQPNSAYGV